MSSIQLVLFLSYRVHILTGGQQDFTINGFLPKFDAIPQFRRKCPEFLPSVFIDRPTDRHSSKKVLRDTGRSENRRFIKISMSNFFDDCNAFSFHTSHTQEVKRIIGRTQLPAKILRYENTPVKISGVSNHVPARGRVI
ncbi:hypothetical protein AVEN_19583-1 [Araneus ventricosus]|uniref:Uncharacterized protein n=1 Tax=Araneus ventricosus TaxID=182803 RepID=A0A4Y2Q578_ARAVE|nr:hypothetical protein AVEN_19583-1 [Araneus ventricosus]